jgi:hypothetical protein
MKYYSQKLRNFFNKRENNNLKRPSGEKRKISTTIALSLTLLFGKARLSSSQPSSPNFGNQEVHERIIDDREFNLLEDNDRQVIFAKGDGNPITPPTNRGPSSFPTSPRVRPHKPYVNPFKMSPKKIDQGLGAGAGGGDPNAEFDDSCPASQNQQPQESNNNNRDFTSKSKKKKKQSKVDELEKYDLPFDAIQKLVENPQLLELSIDPRNGQIDKQSFDEAESILQAQRETGLFDDARRPNSEKGERDIDFIVSGSLYDEVDIKTPKSFFDTKRSQKTYYTKYVRLFSKRIGC